MVKKNDNLILREINKKLSSVFDDYRGFYFYGSRSKYENSEDSDYDIVVIFASVDYNKKLELAGIIGQMEYENDIFIDTKIMTMEGEKSPESIRKNINPAFIVQAIDNGIFYDRQQ